VVTRYVWLGFSYQKMARYQKRVSRSKRGVRKLPKQKYKPSLWNRAKPALGAASGAALGFIGADVPGAYYGGLAGYAAGKRSRSLAKKEWKSTHKRQKVQQKDSHLKSSHDLTTSDLGSCRVTRYNQKNTSKAHYKMRNINQWVMNKSGVTASQGRQVVDECEYIMHRNWIINNTSSARNDRTALPDALYAFDPRYAHTYGGFKAEVARNYTTDKFFLKNIVQDGIFVHDNCTTDCGCLFCDSQKEY